MKLKDGKFYKDRDGMIEGPMVDQGDGSFSANGFTFFSEDGLMMVDRKENEKISTDLIEELDSELINYEVEIKIKGNFADGQETYMIGMNMGFVPDDKYADYIDQAYLAAIKGALKFHNKYSKRIAKDLYG